MWLYNNQKKTINFETIDVCYRATSFVHLILTHKA